MGVHVPVGLRNQAGLLLSRTEASRNWAWPLSAESTIFVTGSHCHKSYPDEELKDRGKEFIEDGM